MLYERMVNGGMDAQMKKGLIEICVMVVLEGEDSYGYQIIKDISPVLELSESTLYPILKRLETGGCVSTYTMEHNGRLRKYYHLTPVGIRKIDEFILGWDEVNKVYQFIEGEHGKGGKNE